MAKKNLRVAILGWGSLLWEGSCEFDSWHGSWQYDGPKLKIEFSRISTSRLGALTLVIDTEHGSTTKVAWCLSSREKVEDAVADLRCRERPTNENIRFVRLEEQPAVPVDPRETEGLIVAWAREKNLDAVVWTALRSNFQKKVKKPFSLDAALDYLKKLPPEGKVKAAECSATCPHGEAPACLSFTIPQARARRRGVGSFYFPVSRGSSAAIHCEASQLLTKNLVTALFASASALLFQSCSSLACAVLQVTAVSNTS